MSHEAVTGTTSSASFSCKDILQGMQNAYEQQHKLAFDMLAKNRMFFQGRDVDGSLLPHGEGKVLVKAGLFSNARHMLPIGQLLTRLGYAVVYSETESLDIPIPV